jgi:hypothetical protein
LRTPVQGTVDWGAASASSTDTSLGSDFMSQNFFAMVCAAFR